MCGMMLRDQVSGTLNPIIGHSKQQFKEDIRGQLIPSQPNKRETCNIHFLCEGLLATHLVCLVQEILHKGSLVHVPQPPKIGDVVVN
jgi:hypothetical protein